MTDSVDRRSDRSVSPVLRTNERTDELRTVEEIQPSLKSGDARARIPKADEALAADPFLPAIERLRAEGRWDENYTPRDLPAFLRGTDCHPRPMFELIPDHPSGCECAYSSHDAARWRPL